MEYQLFITADGSPTLYLPQWDEYYHSKHGAMQESTYVFIQQGLDFWYQNHPKKTQCDGSQMGFGTGLNAYLTGLEAEKIKVNINYYTIEPHPLPVDSIKLEQGKKEKIFFEALHQTPWETWETISPFFSLFKANNKIEDFIPQQTYDLIYYDAFGSRVQPELWSPKILTPLLQCLKPGGVFVTYAALGHLKRTLQSLGLEVHKLPGAPGKRHMIRAILC